MQIHELPEITSISSGGYFATDNGTQTTKIDYEKLAKAIIENYASSTLAGSAQSVKAALDGLGDGSTLLSYADATAIASSADLDSYTSAGMFYTESNSIAASLSHSPVSVAFRMTVENTDGGTGSAAAGRIQRLYPWNTLDVWQRRYGASSGWTAWEKLPTRAEVDALNSKNTGTTYTSVEDLYNYGIDTPGFKFATITSAVASSLTNGVIASASRVFLCRADNTTVDALLFSLATGKIYLSRISNGTPTKAYSATVTEISLS